MEVLHERCCGLDVHKKTVVACLLTPGPRGQPAKETRTFSTMTGDLLAMADWLAAAGCTHVAMESTGSYWKPVYNLLEERFQLLLVNAQHLKAVPGRKTDVKDAEWIAQLLRHGLVRGSFVPARPERELRELIRYRTSLIRERTAEINRVQKTLEGANIKLAAVAANVVGVSGRAMLEAMIAGVDAPRSLAALARGRMRKKQQALEAALEGRMSSHQRFLLREQLRHIDDLDATIARLSQEIEERLRPFEGTARRLGTIPGIGPRTAELVLAEVGPDMSVFPTAGHLASWAGLCPGQDESAGKRRSGRTRKGNPWLRGALVEAAQTAGRTKTYLGEQYHRIAARRGKRRAAVAVAHSLIVIIYHVLSQGRSYEDLGYRYFDERDRQRTTQRLVRRLSALGYTVTLEAVA
jgi:transposase